MIHWQTPTADQQFHLIEDPDLRESFGPLIGRIAASHWWPVDELPRKFPAVMGAQVGFPASWTIDPLKLASILRCADFAHIDERRAPAFLRALRQPRGVSGDHWKFQSKLYQPRLEGDRLIFTAKAPFSIADAPAWWLCFDTLREIDRELRKVDALLADTRRRRLLARGVSQCDDPSRLSRLINTDGWQPVDTQIRVSAVADLVSKLGGKDLYGDKVTPPLREMIQNAADAVRARRLVDNRPSDWGEIRVSLGEENGGTWIQVEDTGVGMSEAVITGPLLDFGTTFWGSLLMRQQLPGLAGSGFQPTGRYGIGFFSVFMWGQRVEVTTQRFDMARSDTLVLSFNKGLAERPLLRSAQPQEYIPDGGTRVKIWLSNPDVIQDLLQTGEHERQITFGEACAEIAPCLDVTLKIDNKGTLETLVAANDWLTISDKDLLDRIYPPARRPRHHVESDTIPPLRLIIDDSGQVFGRAAIWPWYAYYRPSPGTVAVGGLASSSLGGIIGILIGKSERATRDLAIPSIPIPLLNEWVKTEADTRLHEGHSLEVLSTVAEAVSALGGDVSDLPVGYLRTGWVTIRDIEALARSFDELVLVDQSTVELAGGSVLNVELADGVLATTTGGMSILHRDVGISDWPPMSHETGALGRYRVRSLSSQVIRALARGWGYSLYDVMQASLGFSDEIVDREIGTLGGETFVETVEVVCRPKVILD